MFEALDSYGMAVHTAKFEAMALSLSNGRRSQETINDYLLSGYCGHDAVKAVSTFLPEIQVIMVSAHEDLIDVIKARVYADSGMIAVLKKPLSMDRDARYIRIIPARKLQNFSPESSDSSASLRYEEGVT
ncbi:MAG: DNA-binding NtrC family response regulator [Chitinophagales bacterium]|jgi:DNA-binding NtrC family response regulator